MRLLVAALLLAVVLAPTAAADDGSDHCTNDGSVRFCQEGYYCDDDVCGYERWCVYAANLSVCWNE